MKKVRSFKELDVYKLARELSKEIFEVSKKFPKEETYSLTDQMRRASRSIGAQVAEAWGKRKYEKHFVSKLTDSYSEQLETQHWIVSAHDCSYLNAKQADTLSAKCVSIGNMLDSMMDKSSWFCE
jgi:four helix bundle protein